MNKELQKLMNPYGENLTDMDDGKCGPGSTLWYTKPLRKNLLPLLRKYRVKSILDAPCGDFNWIKKLEFNDINYLGGDIVEKLIESNKRKYGAEKFIVLDITEDNLPEVDLIMVRDCLFHFDNKFKQKFWNNFINSKIKYILTSNHPQNKINEDIDNMFHNKFKEINWELDPWNFPPPVDSIMDYDIDDGKFKNYPYRTMDLWTRDQIKNLLR